VEAGLEEPCLGAVMDGVETGAFGQFSRAGHISAKAARKILSGLERGLVYSEACKEVGYDHAARAEVKLKDVRNPVARKAVTEMLKQVRAVKQRYGLPDAIHVELARDVGKSSEERDEIAKGIEAQNKKRDKAREEAEVLLGHAARGEDLLRYELWKEQNGWCLYSGQYIDPAWITSSDNRVQVDHILPWGRFGDDSFMNKTLCIAKPNQDKKNRTPYEWFEEDGLDWPLFAARVEACKEMKGSKKRGFYLRQNAKEVEERFKNRNLGDTRYATRLLLGLLARCYPASDIKARPGPLTAKLRRAWGLEDIKKDREGNRLEDDRHHALDAIVVAATTQSMLIRLTIAAQEAKRQGLPRGFDFSQVPLPTPGFQQIVRAKIADVFVSRAERRRARGAAHAATIKRVEEVDGVPTVFERKAVEKLTEKDLLRIPVPEPYGKVVDPVKLRDQMVAELRRWMNEGRPKDAPPRGPNGGAIRKVRLCSNDKVGVPVRGGTADRGDIVRVDVFSKPSKKGSLEYYLVPVYRHQVLSGTLSPTPPNLYVVPLKDEDEPLSNGHRFEFSLYMNSLVEVISAKGVVYRGYFKGMNRWTAAITVANPEEPEKAPPGIGAKTLIQFKKFNVDRLGNVTPVKREVRTWHGVACT
jgi:CRISPR-associated endonuclease Csn1